MGVGGRQRRRRSLDVVVVLGAVLVGVVSMAPLTSGAAATANSPAPATAPASGTGTAAPAAQSGAGTPAALVPPAVPGPGSAYLGAFVDPSGQGSTAATPLGGAAGVSAELAQLPSFDQGLARPPSLVEVDQPWGSPVDTGQLGRVAAGGAVPVITWECGDTDANVAAGADDALLTAFARQVRSLGAPVMVRWFPDPNSPGTAAQDCLGSGGASGYAAAFRHVRQLLAATGASNASTVWSVDTSVGSSADWTSFYPGAGSTDWIAADSFASPDAPYALGAAFSSWYSTFAAYGKPLLLSNTGAAPGFQARFLAQVAASLPGGYPAVRGVVYFDAPRPTAPSPSVLDADGQAAFRTASDAPYFLPARSATGVAITGGATQVAQGQPVSFTGSVSAPDRGGSVSYSSDGAVLAGCADLPVTGPVDCTTSVLPLGTDHVVASYSGDAAGAPSQSVPRTVVVTRSADLAPTTGGPTAASPLGPGTTRGSTTTSGRAASSCPGPAPTAPSVGASAAGSHKPVVPGPCRAYLGATVDPNGLTLGPNGLSASSPNQPAALAPLDLGLARPLSIVHLGEAWTGSVNATQLEQVFATGAIPMITWSCGDSDSKVAAGADDAVLSAEAHALASTGVPLLLRWFPDPGSVPGDSSRCLGKAGAAGYVQAFRRIVAQFTRAGAVNVGFVWSVDTNSPQSPTAPWSAYFPGGDVVDWIAADGYDEARGAPTAAAITSQFGAWYGEFAGQGKPLMISGAGALAGSTGATQAAYLAELGAVLPTAFPAVKAVVYADAYVGAPPSGTVVDFALTPSGTSAFDALSADPYYQPSRSDTTTSVTASDPTPTHGKVVVLDATVTGSDLGGSLAFYDNGSPVAGCTDVPVLNAGSCETSSLPEGTNDVVAEYLGDSAYGPSTSKPSTVTVAQTAGLRGRPFIPPVGSAYLGAWVRPLPVGKVTALDQELNQLPSFNSGLSRPLSVVHVYQDWATPTPATTMHQVLAQGGTPMIDWRCGESDAAVLSGRSDAMITAFASELAQLKAPVFLRWFYEFNFPNSPDYATCISSLGPAGYAAAFRHIHALFTAAGATNVAFVWCLSAAGQDQDWIRYYPGPSYVDWIAVDGYLRNSATYTPGEFATRFGPWYSAFASFGKPLMITETATLSGGQAQYLSDIRNTLDTGYPMIKGVLYFDAPGKAGTYQYPLDKAGYAAFQALAADSRFQPPLESSTTAVTASTDTAMPAQPVTLGASVTANYGGSVSFFSNGSPVTGCQQLPVGPGATCTTVGLKAGTDSVTAVYNGDAEYGASTSATASVRLVSMFAAGPPVPSAPTLPVVPALDLSALLSAAHGTATTGPGPVSAEVLDGTPSALDLWGALLGRHGYGAAAVLAGSLFVLVAAAYMAVTWIKDQRMRRRLPGT